MPTRHSRWLRFFTAALLVAGGIVFAPAKAIAACGDYVLIAGHDRASSQSNRADAFEPLTAAPSNLALPRLPCRGPGCSNRPAEPEQPLTAPVSISTHAKDCSARISDDVPRRNSSWVIPLTSDGFTVHTSSAIFHPPRAA